MPARRHSTRPDSPDPWRGRVRGWLIVVSCAVLVACNGGSSTPQPSGRTTASPSASPTSVETATTIPSASASSAPRAALGYGARISLASATEVHEAPNPASAVVGEFAAGDEVVVTADFDAARITGPIFGPVTAAGLTWFPVYKGIVQGWVGAASEADFTVVVVTCPEAESIALPELAAMTPGERLACFGNTPITLTGPVAVSGIGGTVSGSWEPRWLAGPIRTFIGLDDQMDLTVAPDVTLPEAADTTVQLEITGHFDDPAADDCEVTAQEAETPEDAAAVTLYCRTTFVLTDFTELD